MHPTPARIDNVQHVRGAEMLMGLRAHLRPSCTPGPAAPLGLPLTMTRRGLPSYLYFADRTTEAPVNSAILLSHTCGKELGWVPATCLSEGLTRTRPT